LIASIRAQRSDEAVVESAEFKLATPEFEIRADGSPPGIADFADLLQQGLPAFLALTESLPGFSRPSERITIYLSDRISASHVIGGYRHSLDPRPIIFLNNRAYLGLLRGINSTVFHELTHLHFWTYGSHSLREGFADFVALALRPRTGVGPNGPSITADEELTKVMRMFVGTGHPPPRRLYSDIAYRQHYYLCSRLFVQHAISSIGAQDFMSLYRSPQPSRLYKPMFGRPRGELFDAAVRPASERWIQ
jgi:hypothetical protein